MHADRYGNKISTESEAASNAYIEGVDLFLAAQDGAVDALQRAIDFDPQFTLAHVALARVQHNLARPRDAAASMVRASACRRALTEREHAHVSIIAKVVLGNGPAAYAEICQHIKTYPLDVLSVQPCCGVFGLIGFSGRAGREAEHLEFLRGLSSYYGNDWWFETQLAFALTEFGLPESGGEVIERAFNANPRNANAAHYFSHVYYELGQDDTGRHFLDNWLKTYSRKSLLHCHLSWHLALWELALGDVDRAWRIVMADVNPAGAWGPPINVLTDMVSFLLRAEFAGEQRQVDRWQEVSRYAAVHFANPGQSFADAHAVLAHAMAGDDEVISKYLCAPEGPAGDQVELLTKAFRALAQANWSDVVAHLKPLMSSHERLGGSRAQRDLLELVMAKGLQKSGCSAEANAWLASRRPRVFRELMA